MGTKRAVMKDVAGARQDMLKDGLATIVVCPFYRILGCLHAIYCRTG
jgi:hypothetical protein